MADELQNEVYFVIQPEWLLFADISDRSYRMYGILRRKADKDTLQAFPKRKTLAQLLSCSVDSVDRAKAELEAIGALQVEPRWHDDGTQATNLYTVRHSEPSALVRRDLGTGAAPHRRSDAEGQGRTAAAHINSQGLIKSQEDLETPGKRKNPWWDALEDYFGYRPVGGEAAVWGRICRKAKLAEPDEDLAFDSVRLHIATYFEVYPDAILTPHALDKHYQFLGSRAAQLTPDRRAVLLDEKRRQDRRRALNSTELLALGDGDS